MPVREVVPAPLRPPNAPVPCGAMFALIRRALPIALLSVLWSGPADAHDYWLAPETFDPAAGSGFDVELLRGGHFVREVSRPYQPERTESFVLVTAAGTEDLRPRAVEGKAPVLDDLTIGAGAALIAMERDWVDIELPDDRFTDYLHHEGLDAITALRDREGHRKVERECYTRALKSLVRAGNGPSGDVHSTVLGHRLEIVLLDDPHALGTGDTLRARVLWKGRPLAGAKLTTHQRPSAQRGKVSTRTVTTNDDGVAEIRLRSAGAWLLRMVHMVPCTGCKHTDWESYWTSFSFAVERNIGAPKKKSP